MIFWDDNNWIAPNRRIKAKVELLKHRTPEPDEVILGDVLELFGVYTESDKLKSIKINRESEQGKFFGFGVFQKATITLIDKDREINEDYIKDAFINVYMYTDGMQTKSTPRFYIDEITRNENTNELTIIAYDGLHKATEYTFADLFLYIPYSVTNVMGEIAGKLFASDFGEWSTNYDNYKAFEEVYYNANYENTDTLKTILDDIAEVTQTVYFVDAYETLTFKGLKEIAEPSLTITKNDYYTFETQKPVAINGVAHITELGDNVSSGAEYIQYVRNNGFWEMHEDIGTAVDAAVNYIGGFELTPFNLAWRGNYALEVCDKVNIIAKDNSVVTVYITNDEITYNGGLKQTTSWSFTDAERQATNPSNIGEALKQTVAKVDKVNKEIELVVTETTQLKLDTKSITASVTDLEAKVEAKVTPEQLKIEVQKGLAEGVNKVTTTTGFTFNDEGLRITKTNSEIETLITEDGMKIYKGNTEVLTADNEGVKATDLHATTYLIIGDNSRFEDYKGGRTACFWIG